MVVIIVFSSSRTNQTCTSCFWRVTHDINSNLPVEIRTASGMSLLSSRPPETDSMVTGRRQEVLELWRKPCTESLLSVFLMRNERGMFDGYGVPCPRNAFDSQKLA